MRRISHRISSFLRFSHEGCLVHDSVFFGSNYQKNLLIKKIGMLDMMPEDMINTTQGNTNMIQKDSKVYDENWLFGVQFKESSFFMQLIFLVTLEWLLSSQAPHPCSCLFRTGAYFSQPINGFT